MRVLDASVITDALAVGGVAGGDARRLLAAETALHAPDIAPAEVTSALRSMVRRGDLAEPVALGALAALSSLRARLFPFTPFARRVWQLRDTVTVYDAWYVALAEALDVPLVTADRRLRNATGPRCPVLLPDEAVTAG